MCCRTSPLSWMNSLVRFQSWVVVTAKFSLSRNCFSKIFYYVPVKVRLACGSALTDHLDYIPRLGAYGSFTWGFFFYVGVLEGVYLVKVLGFFCFAGVWGKGVWARGGFEICLKGVLFFYFVFYKRI